MHKVWGIYLEGRMSQSKENPFLQKERILNKFIEYVVKVTNKIENVNRTKWNTLKGAEKVKLLSKFVNEILHSAALLQKGQFREQNVIYEKRVVHSKIMARANCRNVDLFQLNQQIEWFGIPPDQKVGRNSVVGTATHYGLDGPGIECRWGRDFP
jgi:hypothetical protein